jgi:two-component system, chemotaxis family, CheB/CheR fusion protein
MDSAVGTEFENLLEYLRVSRGFDFGAYKRATLARRIEKRMQAVGVLKHDEYLDYLQVHQEEFGELFNTILINVTSFFRDPEAWAYLREHLVPDLIAWRSASEHLRIWSAGCASGEEAYTLAGLLTDALGPEEFKARVKIYATDLDDGALQQSRQAIYTAKDLENVDPAFVERYFEKNNGSGGYAFDRELRRSIIFGKHDLIQDAPISRVDLLVCRNTLMYFNAEVQERILNRFHFALNDNGILFLGKAETLLTHGNIFAPLEIKHRIFRKVPNSNIRERLLTIGNGPMRAGSPPAIEGPTQVRLRDLALDASPIAQIVVSPNGVVSIINERARSQFGLSVRDIGRPLQDLELSYKPLELRSLIEQAHTHRRVITIRDVEWRQAIGEPTYYDVQIAPLSETGGGTSSASICFLDVTDFRRLQEDLRHFNQELETAYEELQSAHEELQTTNEELQSTIEELETTNEELHSSNEELETINEELQTVNNELEKTTSHQSQLTTELNRANGFLEGVLASLRQSVIVVDNEMIVLAWSHMAEELWGLKPRDSVGKHLFNLDFGFPVDTVRQPLRSLLAEPQSTSMEFETKAINRRGKEICCRVGCSTLNIGEHQPYGVIISMETLDGC